MLDIAAAVAFVVAVLPAVGPRRSLTADHILAVVKLQKVAATQPVAGPARVFRTGCFAAVQFESAAAPAEPKGWWVIATELEAVAAA